MSNDIIVQKTLKDVLFNTLELILNGEATPEMVEQVCYVSEQMIKDDKNSIETEKARMYMEIERQDRLTKASNNLLEVISEVSNESEPTE